MASGQRVGQGNNFSFTEKWAEGRNGRAERQKGGTVNVKWEMVEMAAQAYSLLTDITYCFSFQPPASSGFFSLPVSNV